MNLLRVNAKNLLGLLVALVALAIASEASAYKLKPLYDFCSQQNCPDGATPMGPLLRDSSGNFFGVTSQGGAGQSSSGTVFELTPNHDGSWSERVLHSFCVETNCTDGSNANGQLIMDVAGNLYGTTRSDSESCEDLGQCGLAYELIPNDRRTKWKFKIVYRFCRKTPDCKDGASPISGLNYAGAASGAPYDGVSPLYVAASAGGAQHNGTILELVPGKPRWQANVIHHYCGNFPGCEDVPTSNLFVDDTADIYAAGTSPIFEGLGSIFELTPGSRRQWTATTLQRFCVVKGQSQNCQKGGVPYAPSVRGADGSFFGVAAEGGKSDNPDFICSDFNPTGGCGVLYKLVRDGEKTKEKVLYDFCTEANCTDGAFPNPELSMDGAGNLFGTTADGGANAGNCAAGGFECPGAVFRFDRDGYHQIYSFCSEANCTDGEAPGSGVIVDEAGNLFGAACSGGKYDAGRIYELVP